MKRPTLIEIGKIGFLNMKNPKKLPLGGFGALEDQRRARKGY
jgi:hypothetical protein